MSTFDIKKFLIKEGMTRVSRDRKRLLKEETEYWTSDDYYDFVDSAVGTAAPGMESFGTAFAKNLVTSERIKVVNDGSTYVVYYAKAGEPFVEVTPDNIESLNLTVDFSSPKNWEIEDSSTDDEDYYLDDEEDYDEEDFEREVDSEVLDALKRGHKTKSYAWTYDEEDPESTVIDSVTGMSSFVSRLTDDEYYDFIQELTDAGLLDGYLDEASVPKKGKVI